MILLANMHLVTGYAGQEHVTAVDHAAFNAALIGTGQFVLDKGNALQAQVITNNKIRILDGELMMQGRFVRLDPGAYVDLTIESGASGTKRNDLIVARYTKSTTNGVEEVSLAVIKGTGRSSNPVDPSYTQGDITNGEASKNEFPLWRIRLDGLNVQEPERLFTPFIDSLRTLPDIRQQVETIHSKVNKQLVEQDAEIDEKIAGIESYLKSEVLSDGAKALFGMDPASVPNDVFERLSVLNRHWWEKKSTVPQVQYAVCETSTTVGVYLVRSEDYDAYGSYFDYSDRVEVNKTTGKLQLVNPTTTRVRANTAKDLDLANKYFRFADSDVVYRVNSTGIIAKWAEEDYTFAKVNAYLVFVEHHQTDDTVLVGSDKRDAYPDNGESGSYHYNYLGLPLDKMPSSLRCKTGTYVGTGVYGANNKNILTLGFAPKFLLVVKAGIVLLEHYAGAMVYIGQPGAAGFDVSDKTIEWWSYNADDQMNTAGITYYYFAMG